jgi:hypothetical protein
MGLTFGSHRRRAGSATVVRLAPARLQPREPPHVGDQVGKPELRWLPGRADLADDQTGTALLGGRACSTAIRMRARGNERLTIHP